MAIGKLNKKNHHQEPKATTVDNFLLKAEDHKIDNLDMDLSSLSLEQLVTQYIEIDRQSHLLKGQILLEARNRFSSNQEFGKWRSLNFSGRLPQQTANNLMNLSRFFNDLNRPLGKIPVSGGYLISAPINENIAENAYEKALTITNPTLKDIKDIINELKPADDYNRSSNNIDLIFLRITKLSKNEYRELMGRLIYNLSNDERKELVDLILLNIDSA